MSEVAAECCWQPRNDRSNRIQERCSPMIGESLKTRSPLRGPLACCAPSKVLEWGLAAKYWDNMTLTTESVGLKWMYQQITSLTVAIERKVKHLLAEILYMPTSCTALRCCLSYMYFAVICHSNYVINNVMINFFKWFHLHVTVAHFVWYRLYFYSYTVFCVCRLTLCVAVSHLPHTSWRHFVHLHCVLGQF